MYVRFPLSLRNVEDLLFERGIDICHDTVRLWWSRFGPLFARDNRQHRVSQLRGFRHWRWHLDEMYVKLNGEMVYLWRAVDHEGEVLESYLIKSRDRASALTFMRKALKRQGSPSKNYTDGMRSFGVAMSGLGCREVQEVGRWANNGVEHSHLAFQRRERAMLRFRRMKTFQKFASLHATSTMTSTWNVTPSTDGPIKNDAPPHCRMAGLSAEACPQRPASTSRDTSALN